MTIEEYLKSRNIPSTSLEANSIKEGIEFAVNKACKWMSLNMVDTTYIGLNSTLDKPNFIQRFKKAMEE